MIWTQKLGIRLEYIEPGKPQQNAYIERFNRTARYEWLSQYLWEDLEQVRQAAANWMWTYNHERPNMALGAFTPKPRLAMAAQFLLLPTVGNGGHYPGTAIHPKVKAAVRGRCYAATERTAERLATTFELVRCRHEVKYCLLYDFRLGYRQLN